MKRVGSIKIGSDQPKKALEISPTLDLQATGDKAVQRPVDAPLETLGAFVALLKRGTA